MTDKYCIKDGYKINPVEAETDLTEQIADGIAGRVQKHVYEKALIESKKIDCSSVLDIGCGSGFKLMKYFKDYKTIGLEISPNLDSLKRDYPERNWKDAEEEYLAVPALKSIDLIICSDVLEHILDPDCIMDYMLRVKPDVIVLSTPARELLPEVFKSDDGPPKNHRHIREWATDEFVSYVSKWFRHYDMDFSSDSDGVVIVLKKPKVNSVSLENMIEIMNIIFRNFYPKEMCSTVIWRMIKIARELDLKTRMCGLLRPSCDPIQGHSVCEIFIDGQWVCFDVAYNACLCRPAKEFDDNCFIFYPDYIGQNHKEEFKELFSNITYHY